MCYYKFTTKNGSDNMAYSRDYFVSEKNYKDTMINTVEPFLDEKRNDGYFEALDGKKIHYVFYKADMPKASITVAHGFTESTEKFREMTYYFLKMGLNVFLLDHRGHGLSHRHNDDPEVIHIKYFDQYVDDLHSYVKKVVRPNSDGLPLYLYSHSMGGAVSVRHMQKHPGVFEKAVLSAPMIKARTAGLPGSVVSFLSRTFILLGKEKSKVIGYKGFNPGRTYEESHDTSEERFKYYHQKRIENTCYQTAAPSYRWVNEAVMISKKLLDGKRNSVIKAKVLLCQPEEDSSVYSDVQDDFIKTVNGGRLVSFTKCKHEIYMSVDETVKEYLDTIEDFLFNE